MLILNNHPKLREIIHKLDYSIVEKTNRKFKGWYSSLDHPGYPGDTIFEGHGFTDKLWISVNIIGNEEDLYVHTTLKSNTLTDLAANFEGFGKRNDYLYKVDSLNKSVDELVSKINEDILKKLI